MAKRGARGYLGASLFKGYQVIVDYRRLELTLIPSSNHRFTDRLPELRRAYSAALSWIAEQAQSRVN